MKEINRKLIAVQQALRAPKSQFNEFNNFNYRSAEDILTAVKPILAEQGLSLVLSDTMEYIGERYYIRATATLSDGENEITATAYAREDESRAGMSESQVTGCSSSYARKYCLNGLFCIDDGKDSDSFNNKKDKDTQSIHIQNTRQTAETDEERRIRQVTEWYNQSINNPHLDKNELEKFKTYYINKAAEYRKDNYDCNYLWSNWVSRIRN